MGIYGGKPTGTNSKLAVKEFGAFFMVLLIVLGFFVLVTYRYNDKILTTTDAVLDRSGVSALAIERAEKKAKVIEGEIENAQFNMRRVEGLLKDEKSRLKNKKEVALAEVAALEDELESVEFNKKRVAGLLEKEREVLEDKKQAAIVEIAAKEQELKAEHERIDALYSKEMKRLDEKKEKAIEMVKAKEREITDTEQPTPQQKEYQIEGADANSIDFSKKAEEQEGEMLPTKKPEGDAIDTPKPSPPINTAEDRAKPSVSLMKLDSQPKEVEVLSGKVFSAIFKILAVCFGMTVVVFIYRHTRGY